MRDYLKILCSIIAALLSVVLITSVVAGITAFVSGSLHIGEAVLLPVWLAWGGFVMFGVTGSVFWLGFLTMLDKLALGPMKQHILAAGLSTVTSWLTIVLATSGGDFKRLSEAVFFLVFLVPVVAVSLIWYWVLYIRTMRNMAGQPSP